MSELPIGPYHVRHVSDCGVGRTQPARLADGSYVVEGPHEPGVRIGEMLAIVPMSKDIPHGPLRARMFDPKAFALATAIAALPELIEAATELLPWIDDTWDAHVVEDGSKCDAPAVERLKRALAAARVGFSVS